MDRIHRLQSWWNKAAVVLIMWVGGSHVMHAQDALPAEVLQGSGSDDDKGLLIVLGIGAVVLLVAWVISGVLRRRQQAQTRQLMEELKHED